MPATEPRSWEVLADKLPPDIVTNLPATALSTGQTPDATGMNCLSEGYIHVGVIPTATTRIVKTYTIGSDTYELHYNRLWRLSTNTIIWNAPEYTTVYLPQGKGSFTFSEDSQTIIKMMPIGAAGLIFFKSTGAYILQNAADPDANWSFSDLIQEANISTATHCVELDGLVYFANNSGLYSIDVSGKVTDLSYQYRANITAAAVTAQYEDKLIIIGDTHAYNTKSKKIFKYSGSTFEFVSRSLQSADGNQFSVDDVIFEIYRSATSDKTLKFITRVEARDWSKEYELLVPYKRGSHENVHWPISADTGRSFQLKITSLDSTIKIKRILVRVSHYSAESRDK